MQQADIGLIGLAVMGENLVLNLESKGFSVAVYNRTEARTRAFLEGRGGGPEDCARLVPRRPGGPAPAAPQDHDDGQGGPGCG